ncbi:hypothetical protein ACYCSU_16900 [Paenibacillus sp. ALE1]
MGITKDEAIEILKRENEKANLSLYIQPITRLKYINTEGEYDSVDDFYWLIQRGILSEELQDALRFGQTLNTELQAEYDSYIIENEYVVVEPTNIKKKSLNQKETEELLRAVNIIRDDYGIYFSNKSGSARIELKNDGSINIIGTSYNFK